MGADSNSIEGRVEKLPGCEGKRIIFGLNMICKCDKGLHAQFCSFLFLLKLQSLEKSFEKNILQFSFYN